MLRLKEAAQWLGAPPRDHRLKSCRQIEGLCQCITMLAGRLALPSLLIQRLVPNVNRFLQLAFLLRAQPIHQRSPSMSLRLHLVKSDHSGLKKRRIELTSHFELKDMLLPLFVANGDGAAVRAPSFKEEYPSRTIEKGLNQIPIPSLPLWGGCCLHRFGTFFNLRLQISTSCPHSRPPQFSLL